MTREEVEQILKEARENGEWPDLTGANLRDVDLSKMDLSRVMLNNAILTKATLIETNLTETFLDEADLIDADLRGADLREARLLLAKLGNANFSSANLCGAFANGTGCCHTIFTNANLDGADLRNAYLNEANLSKASLNKAILCDANLSDAFLCGASINKADLRYANLTKADLSGASLVGTYLEYATLAKTNLSEATLTNCRVYGVSAWGVNLSGVKDQSNLRVTPDDEPDIRVDNLEVAQFIYLMLHNEKIRDVIDTIGKKGVLILGRFTPERKVVLDAIRVKLRELGFVPMMFDFEKPAKRDFTETIKVLAGMSRFIIADITNPKSSPLELQATVPDYMIPFVPILHESEEPFSMFRDLSKYPWMLSPLRYDSQENLINVIEKAIVQPALEMANQLNIKRAESPDRHVKDY